ncbi:hypothetical protein EV198_3455 [Roseivirga ehrenbergii]|uniref:SusD-like N-terminal domain-containing protein n=1 Tax=Roseivirga ehrenbergii (strain DSM 102268 / JCM 13514 / KCTC 12282 / NCIMB 14502 / KMM 6017) TaxID=279360 RepID=A0A150WXW6_ROSEK|nr:hypothetical protein [Roseivirga ehrenbergii]KYG71330.1 hypothetical protein MB14_11170 [Roseivirga ehrenbergii]TCK99625.1 hypothetical protein EV198_3455 [Roseivirga ehrenbergii]
MKKIIYKGFLLAFLLVSGVACHDLEVENLNNPDTAKVLASDSDVKTLAGGMFITWYAPTHWTNGISHMLSAAADNLTCSWGNFGMRDQSWEPRKAWDNQPAYSYASNSNYMFTNLYEAVSTANTVLQVMDGGLDIGTNGEDNNLVRAWSKFMQGIGLGYIGLNYDKGFIVDENSTPEEIAAAEFFPYDQVLDVALTKLDEAIALSGNSFTIPAAWMNTAEDLSNDDFKKLINSFAARLVAYAPRNAAEDAAADWTRAKNYADNGITEDFIIQGDGYVRWINEHWVYSVYPGWGQTDMRVIHMMDDDQPEHWDDDPNFPFPPESTTPEDQRLVTDFQYKSSVPFRVERGYYHFSNYRFSRYDYLLSGWFGDMPEILLSENDLIRAEARANLGDLPGAALIINAGTRVTRGNLPPVAPTLAAIKDAIHHERHVELMATSLGIQFYEMRKRDLLQYGTFLHLPVAPQILETMGTARPFYTYGGPDAADGVNASNGGWR